MPDTFPSNNVAIIDVPEVENFQLEFVYNFFTSDERLNRQGSLPPFIHQKKSEVFDAFYVDHTKALPRLNKLTWQPITTNRRTDIPINVSIQENLHKIHSEETFTSDRYSTIHYQDLDIDEKYRFFALRSLREFENNRPEAQQNSPFDLASIINSYTPNQITSEFLHEALSIDSNGKSYGIQFVNPGAESTVLDAGLESLKDVRVNARINSKVLNQLIQSAKINTLSAFPDELQSIDFKKKLFQIQNQAVTYTNSSIIDNQSFDFEVRDYIDIRPIDTNGYNPVIEAIGYVIDKIEYLPNNTVLGYEPIIIENPFTGIVYDGQIRYGAKYGYKIRSIFFVEIQAQDAQTHDNLLVTFLVSSQPSPEVQIITEEYIAPPPPADFNINWDYGERALRLTWNLPPNTQRDIKYFQLLRRKSINEPFEMIKMWDFNDSLVNNPATGLVIGYHETPDMTLIVKDTINTIPKPTGFYLDREFTKDSNYIYAVASIDAHGFSSNYSLQFQVKFDKFANKLIKKMISRSGAPKAYPNAYLNQDTFVDTIKDSGHSKALVVFNPDFMKLLDNKGHNLQLVKTTGDKARYRLQLINIDLQQQKVVDFFINDYKLPTVTINTSTITQTPITSNGLNSGLR